MCVWEAAVIVCVCERKATVIVCVCVCWGGGLQ